MLYKKVDKKGTFLFSAVSNPHALPFSHWKICLMEHHLDFSDKHPASLQSMREDYYYTNIHHHL